jgi:hypothetical protein
MNKTLLLENIRDALKRFDLSSKDTRFSLSKATLFCYLEIV